MDSLEIKQQLELSYNELVEYLLFKYGKAQYDYYTSPACKSQNSKVRRTKEGLFCHHIDEEKVGALCEKSVALMHPYEYQKADRLVYCNILEHLILHIKIAEETQDIDAYKLYLRCKGGIGHICLEINNYFDMTALATWRKICYKLIEDNFEDYINILKYFLSIVEKQPDVELNASMSTIVIEGVVEKRICKIKPQKEVRWKVSQGDNGVVEIVSAAINLPDLEFYDGAGKRVKIHDAESFKFKSNDAIQDNESIKAIESIIKNNAAFKYNSKLAELGDMKAQFELGICYEFGKGVRQDKAIAFEWYKKSADQGYKKAQHVLSNWYSLGKQSGYPVEQNETESSKWRRLYKGD